jgi:hypothetical protein
MKLLYYLPAIGNGDLDKKHDILMDNLKYIYSNIGEKFSISINFYTVSEKIKESVRELDFIENFYIYEKEGVLTELFLTSPANNIIFLYDYVLFVLDDVKIVNLDIPEMIKIKNEHGIDILSPKITNGTHEFMRSFGDNSLTFNNFMEVYFLLMSPAGFEKFCSTHTIENKWMWGADFLFGYYKITAAVIYKYCANHELPSKSNNWEANRLAVEYLNTKTRFTSFGEICREYNTIVKVVEL